MQQRSLGIWGAMAVMGTIWASAPPEEEWTLPADTLQDWSVGEFHVLIQPGTVPGDQRLRVLRGGEVLLEREGISFELAPLRVGEALGRVLPGRDVDGDGTPDLAISEWTGGGHASHLLRVYRLGETVDPIAEVRAGHAEIAGFEDLDGDGRLEVCTHDWTFADWRSAFAFAPAPQVVLRFQEDGLHPAWDLMPTVQVPSSGAAFLGDPAWEEGEVPPALWGAMLDALYDGRPGLAWWILSSGWPEDRPGRTAFREAFLRRLSQSPYWRDLAPRAG